MITNPHDEILNKLKKLRVSAPHGRRSPHKPLLLLLSIGLYMNEHASLAAFEQIEENLNGLIKRYGLPDSRRTRITLSGISRTTDYGK